MTLRERIITDVFKHDEPENLTNILNVYNQYRYIIFWKDFRNLLENYRFEIPKSLRTVEKQSRK